jgi:drug/metabolite transporter (DMT)-like permease
MSSIRLAAPARFEQGAIPATFVFLWATGFIAAKLGVSYAHPYTFLLLRFVLVAGLMLAIALATRAPWPKRWEDAGHMAVVGLLVHALYLGGTHTAFGLGMPAAIVALIVGLQPLLTATIVGPLLGERVIARQWLGLALGFAGIVMVLWNKLGPGPGDLDAVVACVLGLIAITAGTLWQKRFCGAMDWRSGAVIQYGAASIPTLLAAATFGHFAVSWTADLMLSLAWLVLVLSMGAVGLFFLMIRRGAASKVTSLLYLVPPVAALLAWPILGEALGWLVIAGMAVAALGVALVVRR